mmetsp:Transcript_8698/g.14752  ORF Transcript_8698/g.14752 Transcript_8698/m.14752 type:complete len:88 (-) Transcript_8698:484-747(-)
MPQKNPIMNIFYGKVDMDLSDHKPITGLFEAKIKIINQEVRQRLIDKISKTFMETKVENDLVRRQKFTEYLICHCKITDSGFQIVQE